MEKRDVRKRTSEFEFFTGGKLDHVPHSKTADLVIFYNIAVTNIEKMMEHYEKGSSKKIKEDATYRILAEYLWKAHTDERNKSDHGLKPGDKELIDGLYNKLKEIRNYHSHIWHDNEALVFDNRLKQFVERKFELALTDAFKLYPADTIEFEEKLRDKKSKSLFKQNNGKYSITEEGKIFYLSFFLTTGQMSRFLQQRKGSKRTDQPLFKIKHIVYKHYCHRDGASIMGFHHEEGVLNGMDEGQKKNILMARQAYKLITYLHDYPDYLADNDAMPLMLPAPERDEKLKKVNTVQELQEFITAHSLLQSFKLEPTNFRFGNKPFQGCLQIN
jgi:hypothetical protein